MPYPAIFMQPMFMGTGNSGGYHIRDWTTGIEKPSYEVSKPWLDVTQSP